MKNTLQRETMVLAINDQWFDALADPLLDRAGNLIGAVHIISDITEGKLIEEEISYDRFERTCTRFRTGASEP